MIEQALTHALELYGFAFENFKQANMMSDERTRLQAWMMIAARHGAIELYTFWMINQAINNLFGRCPTLKTRLDNATIKRSRSIFSDAFPSIAKIRMAAAHGAEVIDNPEKLKERSSKITELGAGFEGNGFIATPGMIINHCFTITIDGTSVSYGMSKETLDSLSACLAELFAAFKPIEEYALDLLQRPTHKGV